MITYELSDKEASAVKTLTAEISRRFGSVEDEEFLERALTRAQELPEGLRDFLNTFRLTEKSAACVISGYPVDDSTIGPTPSHWIERTVARTLEVDIYFFLCASLLGDPVAWSTQQDGRIMHDVLPIKSHEFEQLGTGSMELLTWHIEEAFHPLRADYIGLFCLRNPDGVETTYATIDDLLRGRGLSDEVASMLREPIFPIRPDRSHLPANRGSVQLAGKSAELTQKCYEWIMAIDQDPEKVPILYGAEEAPYLRLDPYFMDKTASDVRASRALNEICRLIDANLKSHSLASGEILFLDNYRAVHGRKAFLARFDGTDRWLKRLNVTRDLRKSRARRINAASRIIY
jgi:Fe(II)/alpha-ketoglutarate-dependent arginine beta-hydroxylase